MKKLIAVAFAVVFVLVTAAPAVADRPTEFPFTETFTDIDPCFNSANLSVVIKSKFSSNNC